MSVNQIKPLKILHCILGITILLCSAYAVGVLVMNMWHKAPREKNRKADATVEDKLFKDMITGLEQDDNKISYRNLRAEHRLNEFHKTGRKAVTDSQNLCISCHGDIPHYKEKETRVFLNMHAFFMACETCHIRSESRMKTRFVWYEKITGRERERIDLSRFLGNTPYKIMPVKRDGTKLYGTEKMNKYVDQFKSNVKKMIPSEKKAALEIVHKPMTKVENAVKCEECHKSERNTTYLPFKQIGYPERRVDQLVGNEVVGMIGKYKEFYLPNFLKPKGETASDE
jgi:hypothetical protein